MFDGITKPYKRKQQHISTQQTLTEKQNIFFIIIYEHDNIHYEFDFLKKIMYQLKTDEHLPGCYMLMHVYGLFCT